MKSVFVFVSSPSDAADERKRVVRLVERLNLDFVEVMRLEPVLWEDRAYEAHEGFQEQIRKSTDCDVVIAILRGRVGTPLSPEFVAHVPAEEKLDVGPTLTGTTYEIVTAIAARQRGRPLPDIYAFRYAHAPAPPLNATNRTEIEAQWRQLEAFVAQVFVTPEGYFKGALEPYDSIDEFEAKADRALRQWLAEKVIKGRVLVWPIATKGSPFRGLEPFGAKHADVFFGRQGDRVRAIERLKTLSEAGFPFLLVVGPSGSGKSSFVRAGLVPAIVKPGVVGGVGTWRVAVMRPSDGEDALDALARRLFDGAADIPPDDLGRPPALPELADGDCPSRADLKGLFNVYARSVFANDRDRIAARDAVGRPIQRALARIAEAEKSETRGNAALRARLLIVVDQLDEIFGSAAGADAPAAFAYVLEALVASGDVWIVTTLRAESFGAFLQSALAKLLQTEGRPGEAASVERAINLASPTIADIGSVVRGPAEAAGLTWQIEPSTGQRLDDRILADVDRSDLLPLLQFVLQQLFEQRETIDGAPTLTWTAYEKIGSLDGAINTAAESALQGLSIDDRAALPALLRALVAIPPASTLAEPAPILRRAPLEKVGRDLRGQRLVKALTDARILVTTGGDLGERVVELPHQRVIEAWSAARNIIAENKSLLRIREDIETACEAWLANNRSSDRLIPPGRRLLDAEAAASALKDELSPDRLEFVSRSSRAARLRQMLGWAVAAVMFVMAIAAGLLARSFFNARNLAEQNLVAAKQAIRDLDGFVWSANQGAQSMAGVRLDQIQSSLGQVQQTLKRLSDQAPDDLDLLAVRASNFANFVDAYLAARSLENAASASDEGITTADRMAKLDASDTRTLRARTMALYKRGDVRKESLDFKGAATDYGEAERVASALVAKTPGESQVVRLEWVAKWKLGEALLALGDPQARPTFEQATAVARALAEAAPSDPARQRDLALSLASEGDAMRAAGDLDAALDRAQNYLEITRKLAAEHPSDPVFARDHAVALLSVARVKALGGDRDNANGDLNAALDIARRNAANDPLNVRVKRDLLAILKTRADTNLEGDRAAAKADLDEALRIARDFVGIDPGSAAARYDLATVLMTFALNFDDTQVMADEARKIVSSLEAEGLLTPADKATVARFERLVAPTKAMDPSGGSPQEVAPPR